MKKPKQKKKNVNGKESEIEVEDFYELTSSEDESWDDIISREKKQLEEKKLEATCDTVDIIDKGDFVLVKIAGKKTFCCYIAEVIDVKNREIKYLRRLKNSNKFINDATQTYAYNLDDIVCKLPIPHSLEEQQGVPQFYNLMWVLVGIMSNNYVYMCLIFIIL